VGRWEGGQVSRWRWSRVRAHDESDCLKEVQEVPKVKYRRCRRCRSQELYEYEEVSMEV